MRVPLRVEIRALGSVKGVLLSEQANFAEVLEYIETLTGKTGQLQPPSISRHMKLDTYQQRFLKSLVWIPDEPGPVRLVERVPSLRWRSRNLRARFTPLVGVSVTVQAAPPGLFGGWLPSEPPSPTFQPGMRKPVVAYKHKQSDLNLRGKVRVTLLHPSQAFFCAYPWVTDLSERSFAWDVTLHEKGFQLTEDPKICYPSLFWETQKASEKAGLQSFLGTHGFTYEFIGDAKRIAVELETLALEQGLDDTQRQEFVTYWLPLMAGQASLDLMQICWRVLGDDDSDVSYSKLARLDIEGLPNAFMHRFFLVWSKKPASTSTPISENENLRQEKRPPIKLWRDCESGWLEWGGAQID